MTQATNIFVYFENTLQDQSDYTDLFSLSSFKANILHIGVTAEALCLAPSVTVWIDNIVYSEKKGSGGGGLEIWGVGGGEEPRYTTLLHSIQPRPPFPAALLFSPLFYYSTFKSVHWSPHSSPFKTEFQ